MALRALQGTAGGTAPVGGSGTAGTIPRWTGASTLGDSILTQSGSVITASGTIIGQRDQAGFSNAGQLNAYGATDSTKQLWIGIDTTNNVGFLQAIKNGSSYYPITINPSGGNVGIGTTSPASRLDVAGTITCDDAGTGLKLPATPGNADAQTLDCYQENPLATTAGNGWTPTIGGTAAQWGGTLPTVSFARYVQIGSIVFCDVRLTSASITSTYGLTTITPPPPVQNAYATEVVVPASTTTGGVTGNGAQFGGVVYLPTLAASTAIRLTWFYFTTS